MSRLRFITPNAENQRTLDRANDAYFKVAMENNGWNYASAEDTYEALMIAWEFITDITTQEIVED